MHACPCPAHEAHRCADVQGEPTAYATYMATRPPEWERNCIRGLLDALGEDVRTNGAPAVTGTSLGFNLHIAHLADGDSLSMIQVGSARYCDRSVAHVAEGRVPDCLVRNWTRRIFVGSQGGEAARYSGDMCALSQLCC